MSDLRNFNTYGAGLSPQADSQYQGDYALNAPHIYTKMLLETLRTPGERLVFENFVSKDYNVPVNSGTDAVSIRRFKALSPHNIPLKEGFPPPADKGGQVVIKGKHNAYGRVMFFTDVVEWKSLDNPVTEYAQELSIVAKETTDLLVQEALLTEAQPYFAQNKKYVEDKMIWLPDTTRFAVSKERHLTKQCIPSIDEIRRMLLSMGSFKVEPSSGSNYDVLVSPAVHYDLVTDPRVKEVMKYTNTASPYSQGSNGIGQAFNIFNMNLHTAITTKQDNQFLDIPLNGTDVSLLYLYTDGTDNYYSDTIMSDWTKNTNVWKVTIPLTGTTPPTENKMSFGSDTDVNTLRAKLKEHKIHYTYALGANAIARIKTEGHGEANMIVKGKGSAGVNDPLDQRQSIGWKMPARGYKVINPDAVVCYMSCPTQGSISYNPLPSDVNFKAMKGYHYGYVGKEPAHAKMRFSDNEITKSVDLTGGTPTVRYFAIVDIGGVDTPIEVVPTTIDSAIAKGPAGSKKAVDGKVVPDIITKD